MNAELHGRAESGVAVLFHEHYLALVRLAMRLVDDQETAEDLVQDVFLGLAGRDGPVTEPERYLRRAVVNRCRSVLRRRRVARVFLVGRRPDEPAAGPEEDAQRADSRQQLLRAISRLPTRQREAVVLRYYADLSVAQIASVLSVSPGAVSSALNRALASLAPIIEVNHEHG